MVFQLTLKKNWQRIKALSVKCRANYSLGLVAWSAAKLAAGNKKISDPSRSFYVLFPEGS